MTDNRKNGPATDRDQAGRFKPGNPGRPKGSRHRATLALLKLFEGEAGDIGRACIEAAKGGDVAAIRLVLERLLPPAKERPLSIELPEVATAEGIAQAQAAILAAAADGDILPTEAGQLAALVEHRRRALETVELEQRVQALEERKP